MKVGFGKQKAKKHKKKSKKSKTTGKSDGDDVMVDAAQPEQQEEHVAAVAAAHAPSGSGGAEGGETARSKQRRRMELKRAIKVKVANLKSNRSKLTKLAGNRDARRSLSQQTKALMAEQAGLDVKGNKSKRRGKRGGSKAEAAGTVASA